MSEKKSMERMRLKSWEDQGEESPIWDQIDTRNDTRLIRLEIERVVQFIWSN